MKIIGPVKRLSLCAAFVLSVQRTSYASCSYEEAIARTEQLAAKAAEVSQNDPAHADQLRAELKEISPETSSDLLENACAGDYQRFRSRNQAEVRCKTSKTSNHPVYSAAAHHPDRYQRIRRTLATPV